MKKLLFITLILVLQSFSSYGKINDKGLICKCSHMILKPRDSQVSKNDQKCQFLVPIFFKDNKVFIKEFKIIRDKVLLIEFPFLPNWYSDQYSVTWSFDQKDLKGLGLGSIPDFTEFNLSRKDLTLKETTYFGRNRILYEKKCNILSNSEFFNKLKTLKKGYQKEYNQRMMKNKI